MGGPPGAVAAALLLLLPFSVLGAALARRIARDALDSREARLVGSALGIGLAGFVPFLLGLFHLLTPAAAWSALAVAWAAALLPSVRAAARAGPREACDDRTGLLLRRGLQAAGALLLFLSLFEALAPPFDYDTLAYQLAVPRAWIQDGGFGDGRGVLQAHWPMQMNALFAWALLLSGPEAAQLVQLGTGVLLILGLAAWLRRLGDPLAAAAAPWFFLCVPMVDRTLGTGKVDVAVCLFALTALLVYSRWASASAGKERRGLLVLLVLALGLAMGTKLLGGIAAGLLAPAIAARILREGGPGAWRRALGTAAAVLAGTLLVAAPWLVKSWIETGNPVWPFLYPVLGGRGWSPGAHERLVGETLWSQVPGRPLWKNYLLTPVELLLDARRFRGQPQALLWPFAAAALFRLVLLRGHRAPPGWRAAERGLGLFAAGFFLAWVPLPNETRYLLPAFVAVAALAGLWTSALWREGGFRRAAALAVLLPPLLAPATHHVPRAARAAPAALGLTGREGWLVERVPPAATMLWANENLPPAARVLLVGDKRGFYLERDYRWGTLTSQGIVPWWDFESVGAARARLAELGVTHVLVNRGELPPPGPGAPPEVALVHELLAGSRELHAERGTALFALDG